MLSAQSFKTRLLQSTAGVGIALATVTAGGGAFAQQANTTPANVNTLNLLSPFLRLNADATGQSTLQLNLSQSIATNNNSTPAQRSLSISDKSLPGNAAANGGLGSSTTVTLANGTVLRLGVADNLAGGLPPQAVNQTADPANPKFGTPGTITPVQPVGGYGNVLGAAYQMGARNSSTTVGPLAATVNLLNSAYTFTSSDLGVAKNYFANGAATNPSVTPAGYVPVPAVAPAGYTLPTFNGLPNTTNSVLDLAYGVTNRQPGQDVYGSSRPVQVSPQIQAFDPSAIDFLTTNPSFPSGHTNYAYTDSLLLGLLTPSLYQSMLVRGSEYGNSRIVLGVHYPLDIIASRAFSAYDLAQAFTNPTYINNATTTGTALNLPALFNAAKTELGTYLQTQSVAQGCGATVAACATSALNTANDPYVPSAANQALYRQRLNYGLPIFSFAQAPVEAAPASTGPNGSPDASILLAPIYGGSTTAALAIAPAGGTNGSLSTATINQIIVNTEGQALQSFYNTQLSYWSRIDLYSAAGYFSGTNGILTLAPTDTVGVPIQVGNNNAALTDGAALFMPNAVLYGNGATLNGGVTVLSGSTFGGGSTTATSRTQINGALTFAAGSNYAVTVLNGAASSTNVTGRATLNGNVVGTNTLAPTTAYALNGSTLPILTAGSIAGTFQSANLSNAIVATPVYGTNTVSLAITPNTLSSQLPTSITTNQSRTAVGIDSVLLTGRSPSQFVNLFGLPQGALAGTLNQLSGEVATTIATTTITAGSNFLGNLLDPNIESRGGTNGTPFLAMIPVEMQYQGQVGPVQFTKGPLVPAPQRSPYTLWATGTGLGADLAGDARLGSSRVTEQLGGISGGVDYRGAPGLVLGFGLGGAEAFAQVKNGLGNSRSDIFQVGVYGVQELYRSGYVAAAFAYSNAASRTSRTVNVGGISERLIGQPDTDLFSGRVEAGYRFGFSFGGLTPYGAVEVQSANTSRYAESSNVGTAGFGISYLGKDNTNVRFEAGSRFDFNISRFGTVFGRVAYVHQDLTPAVTGLFEALPATAFTINGARLPRDAALVSLGTDFRLTPNVKLTAQALGEIADRSDTIAGRLTLRYDF